MNIRLGCLAPKSAATVKLPRGVMLFCPQCGKGCDDSGCRVSFCIAPESGLKQQVRLQVNCRFCGCFGESPSLESRKTDGSIRAFGTDSALGHGG